MPSTVSLLTVVFTDPRERRLAIALWTSAFSGGAALGPIIGGWILAHWWWGALFLAPLALVVPFLAGVFFVIPESRSDDSEPIDIPSAVTLVLALTALAFGLKRLAAGGPDPGGIVALLVGIGCGVWFLRRQARMPVPLLDVGLFADRVIATAVLANLSAMFVFAGVQFFLAQHLQLVLNLPAEVAGWWMLPGAVGSIAMGIGVVYLARRVPRWALIGAGLTGTALAAGLAVLLRVDGGLLVPVGMYVVMGVASAMSTTLSTDALMAAAPPDRVGAASGVSETAFEVGTAAGIALIGSLVSAVYRGSIELPQLAPAQAEAATQTLGAAQDVASRVGGERGAEVLAAAQSAFVHAENVAGAVAGALLLTIALLVARSQRRAGLGRG